MNVKALLLCVLALVLAASASISMENKAVVSTGQQTTQTTLLNPKTIQKIIKLKDEIVALEAVVAKQATIVVEPVVEKESKKNKKDKKDKKNKKYKDQKKGKKVEAAKPTKEMVTLEKKKAELLSLQTEVTGAGFDVDAEILKAGEFLKLKTNYKTLKTNLKQFEAEWQNVWLTHADNTESKPEENLEATDMVSIVESKIAKLQYKLKEQMAKLDFIKAKVAPAATNAEVAQVEEVPVVSKVEEPQAEPQAEPQPVAAVVDEEFPDQYTN